MADAVQHGRALFAGALDPAFHFDEGVPRLTDLPGAVRAEIEVPALAEILGGVRQPQDRPDLVAQEDDRDRQQDDHGPEHPQHEDMRVGFVGERPARHQPKHLVAEVDANFHKSRAADRVDPERLSDLGLDLIGEGARQGIERAEERSRHRRRQRAWRKNGRVHSEAVGGEIRQECVAARGVAAVKIDQRADVPRYGFRQAAGDQIEMMLHEHERHRRLQQNHRQDDDQQGAFVEPLGQHVREGARRTPPEIADPRENAQRAKGRPGDHPSAINR